MNARHAPEGVSIAHPATDETIRRETLENDRVLVVETTYAPGGAVPMHAHRFPHVLYVIDGGTVQTTGPEGHVETLEARPGQTSWRAPQSHRTRNVGSTPVRILEVEVKDPFRGFPAMETPRVLASAGLEWIPDPMDPTRSSALLAGDPTGPGPYTFRVRVGAGYALGLHEHPAEDEHLTVLSGSVHWSSGAAGSGAPERVIPAGGFIATPAGTPHRVWTTEPTVLQLTGVGPRIYRYLDPADDPRR